MKIKKVFLGFFVLISLPLMAFAKTTFSFEGKHFNAQITYGCEEGNLTCDKVLLKSVSLKDGSFIVLKGKTINTHCPDVCDFKGYEFSNKTFNYAFYPSTKGEDLWDYIVTKRDKVIAHDVGTMK
ncbi:hypothetical protein CKF42_17865 [Pantoea sp. ARC270]|uniref:hypothetical protein n=1 Tax=Pantoea sp. ARC270 TaxID=2027923 RepID=UPI000DA9A334|nr:hypothetical protein [Pantoea sp. ARC270]PZL85280.1 hypothetical protein CKF42_17865 [Pantoea sp. ARC270]